MKNTSILALKHLHRSLARHTDVAG